MKKKKTDLKDFLTELAMTNQIMREQAEKQLSKKAPLIWQDMTPEKMQSTIHELEVHQLELEMQNEEMRLANNEIENMRIRYFDLYDLAPVGYCTITKTGLILEANLTAATMLDLERRALLKQAFSHFILAEDQDVYYGYFKQLFKTGEPQSCELRLCKKDGTIFWVQLMSTVNQNKEDVNECRLTMSDINERKLAEYKQRESEDKFRKAFHTSPDLIKISRLNDGYIIEVNQGFLEVTEYTAEEVIGKSSIEIDMWVNAQDRELLLNGLRNHGRVSNLEAPFRIKNGQIKVGLTSANIIVVDGEEYILSITRDITAFKQAQDAIHESNERFRASFMEAKAVKLIIEPNTANIIDANLAASQFYGYPLEQLRSMNISQINMGTQEEIAEKIKQAELNHKNYFNFKHQLASTEIRDVEVYSSPVMVNGRLLLHSIVHDISERKLVEDALRESEKRFRSLFEQAAVGVALVETKSGRYVDINQKNCDILGYTKEEMLNKSFKEITYADDIQENIDYNVLLMDGIINEYSLDKRYVLKDGSIVWGTLNVTPLWLQGEEPAEYFHIAVVQDITERKRAEEVLRENVANKREQEVQVREANERRILLDKIQTQVWYLSDDHTYGMVNAAHAAFIGLHPKNLAFTSFFDIYPKDEAEMYQQSNREVFASGKTHISEEWQPHHRSGRQRLLSLRRDPVLRDDGSVQYVVCTADDISARYEAQHALKESELKYKQLFEYAGDSIFIHDDKARILAVNHVACIRLGYTHKELISLTISQVDSNDEASHTMERITHLFEHGNISFETVHKCKDGSLIPTDVSAQRIDWEGQPAMMSICRDITERKNDEVKLIKINQQLEATVAIANEMAFQAQVATNAKSRFLANMSHEIRTPLNVILGFSQLMQNDLSISPKQKLQLETINHSGEHLLALLNDILELSKIEAGGQSLNQSTFDLQVLFGDLVLVYRQKAENKKLTLDTDGFKNVPQYIIGDEQKLRQVLINLLSNAVKFTDTGGVQLRAWVEAKGAKEIQLVVLVEDSGLGIQKEDMERLFESFEQTKSGIFSGEGTGLGLAISRQFARLMGGDVSVTSEVGKGSIFRLEILVKIGSETMLETKLDRRQVLGIEDEQPRYKVLVVDDMEASRSLLKQFLASAGFDVFEADSGRVAIELFASIRPELILMDQRMPAMDGNEAIRRIRRNVGGKLVKIITITADATNETRRLTLEAGADDFLMKPFRSQKLFEKISLLLGVRYIYSEALQAEGTTHTLKKEMLTGIPLEMKKQMVEAAICCRQDHLYKLVQQISVNDADMSEKLSDLITKFDYETLIQLFS